MNNKGDMLSSRNHIQMIHRELLHPHPDNPRKDLGDLEELRNSIIEHGIMQNLTIVPDGKGYKILIGHRRFAASEGILEDLPCVIAEGLTDREQVGIMLVENMQRSDLTVFEQAQGFQMMLDLGDTVETIADKTGFSKATVKHRLEINKLDKAAIEEAQEYFQPTITDYIELEKVKDIEKRNQMLRDASSSKELKDDIAYYLREQAHNELLEKYKSLFDSLGWKESKEWFSFYDGKFKKVKGTLENGIALSQPFDADLIKKEAAKITEPVLYRLGYRIEFGIKINQKEKKKTKEELLNEARKKNELAINKVRYEICDIYCKHITEIPEKRIKELSDKDYKDITSKLCEILFNIDATMKSPNKYYNIKTSFDTMELGKKFQNYDLLQQLMLIVWEHLASSYENKLIEWNFTKNTKTLEVHQEFYSILFFFGCRLNDEQKAIIEGTSPLYNVEVK